ncbi:hypothetical protein CPB86DRAFT_782281 [Serendipita vermifera]|nr:hypothetical protein CPB86DRAFT_782281 [Serendipita vermifera]
MNRGGATTGSEDIKLPPSEALLLEFPRSDGDSALRPEPRDIPSRDSTGKINYYREIGRDQRLSTEWRRKIGNKVAEMLNRTDPHLYYLASWPEGYAFFDHNKEQADGGIRHDAYLYGSPHASKFRSTNEFIPHAYWLMTTSTLDNSECECKYCAGKKRQTDVNESVFGTPRATPRLSASRPLMSKPKRVRRERSESPPPRPPPRRQDTKRKIPKYRYPLPSLGVLRDEVDNKYTMRLRYVELHEGQMIRTAELVWIPLPEPIRHSSQKSLFIEFWPALVEDIEYKKELVPDPESTSYNIQEKRYIVTRPLSSGLTTVKVSTALPYRAWDLDTNLVEVVKAVPFPQEFDDTLESTIFDSQNYYGGLIPGVTLEQAAPYFAVAVQTAARMDTYWSPQYEIINNSSSPSATYYQGLWLGAERIWLNELVRIVPDHHDLMSHGILSEQLVKPLEGSESRSMFMRINEIVVDDTMTTEGPRKVCRISGPVFCSIPDPQYKHNQSSSDVLSPPETNTIPAITDGVHFPMPLPPLGFQYGLVTPLNQELTLDCLMIAGRFYPKLPLNPALDIPWIQGNKADWWLTVLAMSGLAPGRYSRCNARYLKQNRKHVAEASEASALEDIKSAWIRPNSFSKQTTRTKV